MVGQLEWRVFFLMTTLTYLVYVQFSQALPTALFSVLLFLLSIGLMSCTTHHLLIRVKHEIGKRYCELPQCQKQRVVVYLMELCWGTISFLCIFPFALRILLYVPNGCTLDSLKNSSEMALLPALNPLNATILKTLPDDCVLLNLRGIETGLVVLGTLYFYELVYFGENMRIPLIFHHLISLLIGALYFQGQFNSPELFICIINTIGATTEQPTHMSMVFYRLAAADAYRFKERALAVAWVTFAILKLCILVASLVVLGMFWSNMNPVFRVVMCILLPLLALIQAHSTATQRSICMRLRLNASSQNQKPEKLSIC